MVGGKVSIKDVARRAGVSTATVSNVFSGSKPVSVDLAQRVRQVAEELGYEVNRAASQLRSGRTNVICVIVPDLSDPFFTSIVTEIEQLARLRGYEIIIASSADDTDVELSRLNALMAWRPAGMIVIPCTDAVPSNLAGEDVDIPFVIADRGVANDLADTILIDNEDAGTIAGKYLAEIGHRDVLTVASDMGLSAIRMRDRGVRGAIEGFGGLGRMLEVGPEPEEAAAKLGEWMERNRLPSAIVGLTNMTTLAALTCLAKRRMRIPEDVSLVGFDDYPWMSARRTALTAVSQPTVEIARAAWDRLMARMEGDSSKAHSLILSCSLEIRDSTASVVVSPPNLEARTPSKKRPEDKGAVRVVGGNKASDDQNKR